MRIPSSRPYAIGVVLCRLPCRSDLHLGACSKGRMARIAGANEWRQRQIAWLDGRVVFREADAINSRVQDEGRSD